MAGADAGSAGVKPHGRRECQRAEEAGRADLSLQEPHPDHRADHGQDRRLLQMLHLQEGSARGET